MVTQFLLFYFVCPFVFRLSLLISQVIAYIDSVVPTVRKALCDPLPEVREAAATTFDNLHNTIGESNKFLCELANQNT